MIEPLFLLALGTGLPVAVRLGTAAADVWLLREQARLAVMTARLHTATELGGRGRDGSMWYVLAQGAATPRTEDSAVDH